MTNNVSNLLLDLLGDKQFWNAVFRSGALVATLPVGVVALVALAVRDFVTDLIAPVRMRKRPRQLRHVWGGE